MKRTQKFAIILAIITALMCIGFLSTTVHAEGSESENYIYDEDTATITLTSDLTFGTTWEIAEDKEYILDLNGYTLTGNLQIANVLGSLTIKDSQGNGKIVCNSETSCGTTIDVTGTLVVESGTIDATGGSDLYGLTASNGGTIIVNGGTIKSTSAALSGNNTTGAMTFEVNGGILYSETGVSVYMPGPYGLTINDGTLYGGIALRMGYVNINGGTIYANFWGDIDDEAKYYAASGYTWLEDAIYVYAGTYSTNVENATTDYSINITGGTIIVDNESGNVVAIYDIGKETQTGSVNISGGTFTYNGEAYVVKSLTDIGVDSPKEGYGVNNTTVTSTVSGGTYSKTDVIPEYDENTYMLLDNEDGTYTVVLIEDYPEDVYDITTNDDGSVTVTEKDADYSAVEEVIAKADALNESDYTEESWADLQQAIANVVYGLKISDQDTVDFYAEAIQDALDNLVKVDEEEQTEEPQDNEEGEQLEEDSINPKTGDMIILFGSILLIAVAGLIVTIKIRKRASK